MLPPRMYGGSGTRPNCSSSASVDSSVSAMGQPLPFLEPLEQPQLRARPAFAIDERDRLARVQMAARLAQNPPVPVRRGFEEQPLPAAAGLQSLARQLGRNDLRIVEHEPIAARQQMRQIADVMMLDLLPPAVDDHQPGIGAVAQRLLGHQVARQLVIEPNESIGHIDVDSAAVAAALIEAKPPSIRTCGG